MIDSSMAPTAAADVVGENRLLNRELSSLEFYARVLELAADPNVPLLERVRFCSIFSSHLDEFFMVRVAGLRGQEDAGVGTRSPDGRTASQALAEIRDKVLELTSRQSKLWKRELRPALAAEGIVVAHVEDCEPDELEELKGRFERQIYPVLTPLAVGPGQPFPYISGLSLSLGLFVRDPKTAEERFARVKVPELLPRFLPVGKRGIHLPLESVIRHFLPLLFPKMEIVEHATFRVARNADFEVSDEADDLLEAVELELRRRRFGEVVRLEVAGSASSRMLSRLQHGLGIGERETFTVQGLLDLVDVGQFADLPRPELKYEPWVGITHPRFAAPNGTIFDEVRRGDILVHHPYTSFATSFEAFVRAASDDPSVVGLKATVYRTSDDSPLVPALIEAAEEGKQSVCLVELKARFDEHRNIEWSRALERAGVHVVYGFSNLKIHGKTTLVVRREGADLKRYVHVGTGNYHARTARGYEDFGLFTADEEIAADVADLFNYITGFGRPREFRKILVAPFGLRERLIERIRAVAKHGKDGRIRIKVNSLTDPRDRGAVRGLAGGRARGDRRAKHLLAAARCGWTERDDSRSQRAWAVPRAQPALGSRVPGLDDGSPRQRRSDAAQPRQPRRGRRSHRGCARAAGDLPRVRRAAGGQRGSVGSRRRWPLAPRAPRERRAEPPNSDCPDEERAGPCPPSPGEPFRLSD
jgi:polyphosphate kinase